MRLATVAQSKQIDQTRGIAPEVLMEAAGTLAADRIARRTRGPVTVVCGPGHNGADGLVVARHLRARGRDVRIHLVGETKSALFDKQLARLGVAPGPLRPEGTIVDALFGIGFRGPLERESAALIERLNAADVGRISLDVPSGLDADRGLGPAVRADVTLTFGPPKPGFFVNDGPAHVGELIRLNIGYPRALVAEVAATHRLFGARNVRLRARPADANKTTFGNAVILAGSPGLWGAGVLSADAAFRVGAGYVTWASFEAPGPELLRVPEMMTTAIDDERTWAKATAFCIGPGLGAGERTAAVIERLKTVNVPTLVDADALTACVTYGLFPLPSNWIITPHAGEMARILGRDAREIERDHFRAVTDAYARVGCITLLKGFRTIVYDGRRFQIIDAGNSALAKAGSGDTLSGIITGLLAQHYEPGEAAALGAYLHGRVADDYVADGDDAAGLRASDLIARLPRVMAGLR